MRAGSAMLVRSAILFDTKDHELLRIVEDVLKGKETGRDTQRLFHPYFHPHGIKELTESRGLRIAYSVALLLSSLEEGEVEDRLNALRSLKQEVLGTAGGPLPGNTARVLLQIMKELIRAHGDHTRQLRLARDFRTAAIGKPRFIREQLKRYHLLEMPEAWNQVSFDDHVHDFHTKGRKSPTHLIMDAWIKGIRRLRVIYYNYIQPHFAGELLEAAAIMEIKVRVGIEFSARFRDRYVHLIWVPRGFAHTQAFLAFLAEPHVAGFLEEGRRVSEFQQCYVFAVLDEFNRRHREALNLSLGLDLASVDRQAFLAFVGSGQASMLHLAKFLSGKLRQAMAERVERLRETDGEADDTHRGLISMLLEEMHGTDEDAVAERYLAPSQNPAIADINIPCEGTGIPGLIRLSPSALIDRLVQLNAGFRITLNLSNLRVEDVLEILYDCKGRITRLEIFNLKDYVCGKTGHIQAINELQCAINSGNVIAIKKVIRDAIAAVEASNRADGEERVEKLNRILHDISSLKAMYSERTLKSRIASDSTGRTARMHGMGMVIRETLPLRAQIEIHRENRKDREVLPVHITAHLKATRTPLESSNPWLNRAYARLRSLPGLRFAGYTNREEWVAQEDSTRVVSAGNVVTLGGVQKESEKSGVPDPSVSAMRACGDAWKYLNSRLRQVLKVIIGFVPAFLTFALTKDWWFLAWFGAVIWFGITGLRNILQSVLGGGGLRRSPFLRWNDYVSWERMSDSLLFTGLSVPLLEYLVKTVMLDHGLGINTSTNAVALYAIIGLVNGIYVSSHNAYRGLQATAIWGNFFRSVLSIPLALGLNQAVGGMLGLAGAANIDAILQKWAVIISKAASDTVAGIIEGLADRYDNITYRLRDYRNRLGLLFDTYARLELLFPEAEVFEILDSPEKFKHSERPGVRDMERIVMITSLDLLYFWTYQPRARTAMHILLGDLSNEEKHIFLGSQFVLLRQRTIGRLLTDGILGKNFSKALSFYLDQYPAYLQAMEHLKGSYSIDKKAAVHDRL